MESYAQGETTPALLEETIGANFERTVASYADREALVEVASGRRWTWSELGADVDALARGLVAAGIEKGDRVGIWAPNCAEWTLIQYATAKIGAILVNVNPAYRTHELAYAVNQSGLSLLVSASSFKTSDYRAMVEEVRGECPGLDRVVYLDTDDWADLVGEGERVTSETVAERLASLDPGDPINIQYTSGTTGRPKGATLSHRNILNNGFFTTELINFTEQDRLCIPVPFYHCFGMVMANLGCTTHGATMVIPAPGFDPEITLRTIVDERCTAVYGVPTMFIAMQSHPSFADHDLEHAQDRCHGRVDLSGRGDEALHRGHAHGRGVHLLRHDRDQPGLDPDPRRRRPRAAYRQHRPGPPARRDQGRRPGHGQDRRARRTGRALHPRLLRDARLLGRPGEDRGGDRLRGLDAHRRPRRDARGRLLQHRRPDQGHGDPRRGEHLPARDRGVPAHPSRHRGRPGGRRSRREVRRGAVRVGDDAVRCRAPGCGTGAGVRRRTAGPLQGPALRHGRRGVPDDRDRQGAQGEMREKSAAELDLNG